MITTFLQFYAAVALSSDSGIQSYADIPEQTQSYKYEQSLPTSLIPLKKPEALMPVIEAEAAIIVDLESGAILYEKNSNTKLQIASITKLMTAVIALEQTSMDEEVVISSNAAQIEGSKAWLLSGETISMRNLLKALVIKSGNDAAVAIAEHISGDVASFVEEMNVRAKELGLFATHFENPIGFDNPDNYSSVYDISLLARYAYRKQFIKDTANISSAEVSSTNGEITHKLESTNKLLDSFLDVLGLKTGHTDGAGLCFVSIIQDENDNKIITVVLNSPARFSETKELATWAFRSHIW